MFAIDPEKGKIDPEEWREMEEAMGVVKHVLLVKFKEGVSESEIDQLIKDYANLVNLIDPMESFHWYPLYYLACDYIKFSSQIFS